MYTAKRWIAKARWTARDAEVVLKSLAAGGLSRTPVMRLSPLRNLAAVMLLALAAVGPRLSASPSLVGTYYTGPSLGPSALTILPDGGYSHKQWDDLGWTEVTQGHWALLDDGSLLLMPKETVYETSYDRFPVDEPYRLPSRFVPVLWRHRQLLIEDIDMLGFCNGVNNGYLSPDTEYILYLSRATEGPGVDDPMPCVPPAWQAYLLPGCSIGRILSVYENEADTDLGAADGLRMGMELEVWDHTGCIPLGDVRVIKVGLHKARLRITFRGDRPILSGSIVETCNPEDSY